MALIFHVDGALNFSEIEDLGGDQTALYHNNGQFLSPGLKVSIKVFGDWWLNLGGFGAFTATNQGAAGSVSVGLAYNLQK